MKKRVKEKLFFEHSYLKVIVIALCVWLTGSVVKAQKMSSLRVPSSQQAQNLRIDKGTKLVKALEKIEHQFDVVFLYRTNVVNGKVITQTKSLPTDIDKALKQLLKNQAVRYKQINSKTYGIYTKQVEKESTIVKHEVHGIVVDMETKVPLPGVNILIKGTTQGTTTNKNGKYTLTVSSSTDTLIFSFIGYQTKIVPINGRTEVNIELQPQTIVGKELVVVGYGTQKREAVTGSVSSVDMEEVLGNRPVSSTAQALQGTVPGLRINSSSGKPGETLDINIRGVESINGGAPLVLVNNVPMSLDDINPNDIKTITVLKDAAAASIYGGRAAFGVILITTKSGSKNQPIQVSYSNNFTISEASEVPQKASTLEYVRALLGLGMARSWNGQSLSTWEDLLVKYKKNPSAYPKGQVMKGGIVYRLAERNYYDTFMQSGFEQQHNLSFSGGSEKTSYRISLGYTNENGILVTDKDSYTEYNLSAFINTELTRNLDANVQVFYNKDKRLTPSDWGQIFRYGVQHLNSTPTGYYIMDNERKLPYYTSNNILKFEKPRKDFNDNLRLFGKLTYTPLEGLSITSEYTFEASDNGRRQYYSTNEYMHPLNYGIYTPNNFTSYLRLARKTEYHAFNLYAKYEQSINNHNFELLLGTNQEKFNTESFQVSGENIISPGVPAISTAIGTIDADDSFGEYAISGYFGRLRYNYKNKYLLQISGRYDGSSRFPAESRYGFFPSISAGWIISDESFMEPLSGVIDYLKLRASWGEIGNQNTGGYYPYYPGMSPYKAQWVSPATDLRYITLSSPALVSSNFTWETVRTINVGIDVRLFKSRLSASFDLFRRQTLGMLAPGAELPAVLGNPAPLQNVADLESKGWELSMEWRDNVGELHYSIGFNLSDNRGFITEYNNPAGLIFSGYYEGQEIGEIWGYTTKGFFTVDDFKKGTLNENLKGGVLKDGIAAFEGYEDKQNPGDIRYVDINGDGVIDNGNKTLENHGDIRVIGNTHRRYIFGVNGSISYKNFSFSFLLQGVGKRDIWIENVLYWPYKSEFSIFYKHNLNYWSPDNTNAYFPRIYANAGGNTHISSKTQTRYLANGAYLRVKNITLGYSFSQELLKHVGVGKVYVFISGENLFKFNHLPEGISAESYNISRGGSYPHLRKYSFGVNISF